MTSEIFRSKLETIIGDIDLDKVKIAIEELITSKKKVKNIVEQFLKDVDFKGIFEQHPLVMKIINLGGVWGNATREYRESNAYRKLQEKLNEILKEQRVKERDLLEIRSLLRELRNVVIDFIEKLVGDTKKGLRHLHAPGSVAKDEAINLYFGEKLTSDDLYKLASRFCSSIAFGENIGIYSENEDFMEKMGQLIGSFGFGLPFRIERDKLREIGIQEYDLDYPYVVLLKFIMWLRNQIDVEEDPEKKGICLSILNMLRLAIINMFFMPPDKEKWCTLSLPRLDFFINNWIQKDEARKSLEALVDNIDTFIRIAIRESKRKKEFEKIKNAINLLMNNYEILCRKLIEYGVPDFYALRNLIDIMVDLSIKYDIKLHFKSLTLAT